MILSLAVTALLVIPVAATQPERTRENAYSASAYDQNTGELLYVEEHREVLVDGRHLRSHVLYRHRSGDTLATKLIEFGDRPLTPDFRLDDHRDGYVEGARVERDSLILYRRWSREAEIRRHLVRDESDAVVDGGFDKAVRRAWDELLDGEKVAFDFAVPNKLRSYRFRIRRSDETVRDGRPAVRLKIEPANFFVRLVAPAIELTYDVGSRRLLTYEGITNVADGETGKRYRARIEFSYPPELLASMPAAAKPPEERPSDSGDPL